MAILDSYQNKFLIIIAGPTAVGKSSLAIKLAKYLNIEIFSADSRQLYKEMSIGTAKPSAIELSEVNHHFINLKSIIEPYSVGHFEQECKAALDVYFQTNDMAILVGGTGLYIKALLDGMDDFPEITSEITMKVQNIYETEGIKGLQLELEKLDPDYYMMVDIHNQRRLSRALEVCYVSKMPYSHYLKSKEDHVLGFQPIMILLEMDRDQLYKHINARVDMMIDSGLEAEARNLYTFKHVRALDTVGYKEFFDYFDGKHSYERAVELIKQNSRRYAKRQLTWFRNHGNWEVFNPENVVGITKYIKSKCF